MGVTPSNSEPTPARPATAKPERETSPKSETRSKFEEAMRRMREGGAYDQQFAGGEELLPFERPLAQRHSCIAADDRNGGDPVHGLAGPAAAQPAACPAEGVAMSGNAVDIAPSHYEFLSRIGLPAHSSGVETQLTMTDQRWFVSHAILRHDDTGGLSVEIQTRSDADAEQQRQALRSRLEARGHRVTSIHLDRE